MAFLGIFKSKAEKERLSHIKSLIALSMVDGKMQDAELWAIAEIGVREGVNPKEVERLLASPGRTELIVPDSYSKREQYLKDMVRLMISDGNIDDNEMAWCKMFAEAFGYEHEVIDAMLQDIVADFKAQMGL